MINEFNALASGYKDVFTVKLPRSVCPHYGSYQLHVFCDASAHAYGAVTYICAENGSLFLMSRSRVSPIKTKTIPQLELTAFLLGCRLAKYVKNLLNCELKIFV